MVEITRRNSRRRLRAVAATAFFVAVGWPSKYYGGPLEWLVVGSWWDVCGSAAIFFVFRAIFATASLRWLIAGVWTALICNELLQLATGPLLDTLRRTPVGPVVLGSSFDPLDLIAITIGVGIAAALDAKLVSVRSEEG